MEARLESFVSDFLGAESLQHTQQPPAGTTAIATGNSRQIVGNIIHNYYSNLPADTKLEQAWLRVQQWLVPSQQALDTQTQHDRDARASHFEGTCSWYIDSEHFKAWLDGSRRLEWLHTGAGRGKTVLFSAAVAQTSQHCHHHKAKNVCYFYCTIRDPSGTDATVLLRFLLIQLFQPSTSNGPIMNLYNKCHAVYPPKIPTTRDLTDALFEVLQDLNIRGSEERRIYFMIDGLDEIPFESVDRQVVLDFLSDLAALNLDHVSLFATSRDQPDIQDAFTEPVPWSQTEMDSSKVQQDINNYVSRTMQSNRRFNRLSLDIKETIKNAIGNRGNGMFLWSALQMSYLASQRPLTNEIVLEILQSLPPTLDATYYRILSSIHDRFIPLASRALKWLVFSSRTLFIEELVEASAIDLGRVPEPVLDTKLEPYQLFEMLTDIISIQPALTSYSEPPALRTHKLSLCHASVGEFLQTIGSSSARGPGYSPRMDAFLVQRQEANLLIARACLAYLFYYNRAGVHSHDFPLLSYSWYRWERHIGTGSEKAYPSDDGSISRANAVAIYTDLRSSSSLKSVRHGSVALCLDWLPHGQEDRLLDAINMPYFYPNFELFFQPPVNADLSQRSIDRIYQPLEDPYGLYRALEVLPCLDTSTTIRCRLSINDLNGRPANSVASYAFISHDNSLETVMVNGEKIGLLPSEARLLGSLRSREEGALSEIWPATLSINRADGAERVMSVRVLGRIDAQAQKLVVTWYAEICGKPSL